MLKSVECRYLLKYCTLKVFHFVCDMIPVILISKLKVICAMFVNRGMKKLILNSTTSDYVRKRHWIEGGDLIHIRPM